MFDLTFRIEVLEVVLKFVDKNGANVELLVKLFNLLHSFLVVGVCFGDFHELRSQIGENVGEISYAKNDDDHRPE